MKSHVIFLFLLGTIFFSACNSVPENGHDVLNQMHRKWKKKMPSAMYFDQQTRFYEMGYITKEEVWQEAMQAPGKLHIRINGFETGNGIIFARDSAFYFTKSNMTFAESKIHYLLTLSMDVYHQDPELTAKHLETDGFDLSKMHESTLNDREVYVVGSADDTDKESNQFVIDKKQLVVLRTIRKRDGNVYTVDFTEYNTVEGYFIATKLQFASNGNQTLVEEYKNIRFPEDIDKGIFDPTQFGSASWK